MKRNFVFGLFGGLIGSALLLMLLSAAGVVGARAIQSQPDAARTQDVSAAFETITSTQQPQGGGGPGPVGPAFTYQGLLKQNSVPINTPCDFLFSLWDSGSGGLQIGTTETVTAVTVSNGLFDVVLNFNPSTEFGADAFNGQGRWLAISVRCPAGGTGAYTALSSRQPLWATPYAMSLMPGAVISGTAYQELKVENYAATGNIPVAATGEIYNATDGFGLFGVNYTSASTGVGVFGQQGPGFPFASFSGGVVGESMLSSGGIGVAGEADGAGSTGVRGISDIGRGVYGSSSSGRGVYGSSSSGRGVYGTSDTDAGVYGTSATTGTVGIGTGITSTGVYGTGGWFGVHGLSDYVGVFGYSPSSYGVYGSSPTGDGVYGTSTSDVGVEGVSNSGDGVVGFSSTGYAGHFDGNVFVNGNLSASGTKPFKIDNPLDPAKQYLYHYAVESPQVQNMYNGTATLDAKGEAVVTLPAYFSAINSGEFQYQLTAIGAPMPNLYVAEEITDNHFQIAGGVAGKKVSWTVFGQRSDPWLRDHPQTDVVDKPAKEAGTYLYPEGYGQPVTAGVDYTQTQRLEPNVQSTVPSGQP